MPTWRPLVSCWHWGPGPRVRAAEGQRPHHGPSQPWAQLVRAGRWLWKQRREDEATRGMSSPGSRWESPAGSITQSPHGVPGIILPGCMVSPMHGPPASTAKAGGWGRGSHGIAGVVAPVSSHPTPSTARTGPPAPALVCPYEYSQGASVCVWGGGVLKAFLPALWS